MIVLVRNQEKQTELVEGQQYNYKNSSAKIHHNLLQLEHSRYRSTKGYTRKVLTTTFKWITINQATGICHACKTHPSRPCPPSPLLSNNQRNYPSHISSACLTLRLLHLGWPMLEGRSLIQSKLRMLSAQLTRIAGTLCSFTN